MPLDKRCSREAAKANFSTLYGEGKRNPQLSAIVLNVLKRSCGVDSKAKMSVDQIVAAGGGLREARAGRILYHIGRRPPKPEAKRVGHWAMAGQPEPAWVRPWLDAPVQRGVFLTPNPMGVAYHHAIRGHLYAYQVPHWVIKEAGGIHRYDKGSEVLIPEPLWKHVRFLGKSKDKQRFDAAIKAGEHERGWAQTSTGMEKKAARLARQREGRWRPLADLFEELPSSPAVRGLSFSLPGGMRGAGTSPSASPPEPTRGLVGYAGNPMPLAKCPSCGAPYKASNGGICPKCGAKVEAVNLAGGMRMDPLVGASVTVACKGCGGPVRIGEKCRRCGMEA